MRTECVNTYKRCREDAGFSQAEAAEMIFISIRSLSDYETGKTIPGDDTVCKMVEAYQMPELAYLHLKLNTEVGKRYLPDLHLDELPKAVLRLQKESRDMREIETELITIACDGVVDKAEIPVWEKAKVELHGLAGAALAVLFHKEKKKPLEYETAR